MNSTTKTALLAKAQQMLRDQIKDIQRQLTELQESSEVEEKSSAGDKFETHQEMLHQTRDILEKRLASSRVMLAQLNAVPVKEMSKVDEGALLQVPMGKIWVSIPMGKVVLDGVDYQLVSRDSPLISALWDLEKGQSADFRGKQIEVKDLV
jgi:hypothetical protein